MKIEQPNNSADIVKSVFKDQFNGAEVDFGFVSIPAGARLPIEGTTFHAEQEYSFIIKGGLSGESGGKPFSIQAGEASFIPAGEAHWCVNEGKEPCELVYALVKAEK